MIRLYAWERAQALRCKLVYRGYDRGNTRTFGLAGLGFTLAQPIYLYLDAARSFLASNTRPSWWPRAAQTGCPR